MATAFIVASIVAVLATLRVIASTRAVHALLYLVVSLLAVAVVFYTLGATFAAILEALVYAGAIIVLFVFVVMMLNLGDASAAREREWLAPGTWVGPALLAAILLGQMIAILWRGGAQRSGAEVIGPHPVGALLFGPYLLAVELASVLLLAGLVSAYHLGHRQAITAEREPEG